MKHILWQAALTLLSCMVLYLMGAGGSFLMFPAGENGPRNFQAANDTLYMTIPKYIFLGRSELGKPDSHIILVGASNTGSGFKQTTLQSMLQCGKVSNLGIGGANISEVAQVIDLVHEVQDEPTRRRNAFVIGVWFGMFVDSDLRYADADRHRGDTDIDIERYRYGFYRRGMNGPVAILPPTLLDTGVTLIRPLLFLEKLTREARAMISLLVTGRRSAQRTEAEREAVVMSEKEKRDALKYWDESMGRNASLFPAQVNSLKDAIGKLLLSGEKVVLLDLPIPAWHRDASPYVAAYREVLKDLNQRFSGSPDFVSMNMKDLDQNLDYSDEVHAKPHLGEVWANRLATVLNSFVCAKQTTG